LLDFYNQQASKVRASNAKRLGSASTNTFLGQQLLGLQQQTGRSINEAQLNAYNQAWSDQLQQQSSLQDRLGSLTNVLDFYQRTVQPYAQLGSTATADAQQLLLAQKKAIDAANSNNFKQANSGNTSLQDLQKTLTDAGKVASLFFV
jgi:DNA repair exonuclease SbcCD ATPase subunit